MSYQSVSVALVIFTGSLIHEHGVYLIAVSCLQFCSPTILIKNSHHLKLRLNSHLNFKKGTTGKYINCTQHAIGLTYTLKQKLSSRQQSFSCRRQIGKKKRLKRECQANMYTYQLSYTAFKSLDELSVQEPLPNPLCRRPVEPG